MDICKIVVLDWIAGVLCRSVGSGPGHRNRGRVDLEAVMANWRKDLYPYTNNFMGPVHMWLVCWFPSWNAYYIG